MLVAYAKLALKEDLLADRAARRPVVRSRRWPTTSRRRCASSTPTELAEPPAAPRDHHQRGGQLDGQPRRHHLRLPGRRRRPAPTPEQVARAFVVCREVFDLPASSRAVEALDNVVPTGGADRALPRVPPAARPVGALVPQTRPAALDVAAEVERFRAGGRPSSRRRCPSCCRARSASGCSGGPQELEKLGRARGARAARRPALLDLFSLLDIVEIAPRHGRDADEVAPVYFVLSERFGIDAMLTRVTELPRDDRWDALARGALRDDLYAVLESLTVSVLDASDARRDRRRAVRAVGEGQRRRARPGPATALAASSGSRTPATRRAVGGPAHPARGHPQRVGHDAEASTAVRQRAQSAPH